MLAWSIGSREDWKAKLATERPDAVAIATPASLHAVMALAALDHDLPVFIEKPMATSLGDAERIRDAAARKKLPVVVDHIHLFNPAWRELTRRIHELGVLREAESEAGNAGPFRADITPLWDWGAHDIAMAIDLGGVPVAVAGRDDEDGNHRIEMTFASGLVWRARVGSRFTAKTRRAVVRGSTGEAVWDDLDPVRLRIGGMPATSIPESPLAVALGEFAQAVGMKAQVAACSGADLGVAVVRILVGL